MSENYSAGGFFLTHCRWRMLHNNTTREHFWQYYWFSSHLLAKQQCKNTWSPNVWKTQL